MGTNRTRPRRLLIPYSWYRPFRQRLRNAWHMWNHRSPAWKGTKKKPGWPEWRKQLARAVVVFCTIVDHPEVWLLGHYDLSYPQCAKLRRLMYWESRLYRWSTGYDLKDDED